MHWKSQWQESGAADRPGSRPEAAALTASGRDGGVPRLRRPAS